MSRRSGFTLAMALLLAVGLIASYVLGKLEPYEDVIEHGPSPEVASSPYLAAEHFLRKQGIAARRAEGLEVLGLVAGLGQQNLEDYSRQLTLQWQALAYGHRLPAESLRQSLCQGWRSLFGQERAA